MLLTYESLRLYASLKKSASPSHIGFYKHFEESTYEIFSKTKKRKTERYLRTLVPTIASRACSGVVGYTTEFASPALRQEIARIIGEHVDDQWQLHNIWIQYLHIHIPTIVFPESVYTILHGSCFPERRRLPCTVDWMGRRAVNYTSLLKSIRQDPQERIEELQQLFKNGRRGAPKILCVLYGIDDMVRFCICICFHSKLTHVTAWS